LLILRWESKSAHVFQLALLRDKLTVFRTQSITVP
jgi:hypothetical protein